MARRAYAVLIGTYGLVHLLGFAKAFGLGEPDGPPSTPIGMLWLGASFALVATSGLVATGRRGWWAAGLGAVVLSQTAIAFSWGEAWPGTIVNALALGGIVYGFASGGPVSFLAEYREGVRGRLAGPAPHGRMTDEDLRHLPTPVARYIRLSGAVGRPRVNDVESTWRGRIRAGPGDPWMVFTARQHNFVRAPARFYHMEARRGRLPVDVLHVFRDGRASMRVRLLSLFPLVSAAGPELTRAETVTLFNDLCMLAPGALIDAAVAWDPVDERTVDARFTAGGNTIRATLMFDETGELVNFVSDDRLVADGDGFTPRRWSTPLRDYREFGPRRAASRGDGRWHLDDGEFTYIEVELLSLRENLTR